VLGGELVRALDGTGARVALNGRDGDALQALAGEFGGVPAVVVDAVDVETVRTAVDAAVTGLGGLDAVVVAWGVVAFGPAAEADDAVTEELFAVNTLAPMSLVRAALPHLPDGGAVVLLSAIVADAPNPQMAEYSASRAALSVWAGVLRRELRTRSISVFDVRPPHIDTGLVAAVLDGLRHGGREIVLDPGEKRLARR
jgi:NAD(P)-dependent dehydrogenase (short-subunit alcohol dehydrogenase family)